VLRELLTIHWLLGLSVMFLTGPYDPSGHEALYEADERVLEKVHNHVHMVALYAVWYNWLRIHKSLRVTPAMAAGLTDKLMGFEDIVALMDAAAPAPNRPAVYRKKPRQISN
jgi:hypothetical protein